jgi:hypothetical protein
MLTSCRPRSCFHRSDDATTILTPGEVTKVQRAFNEFLHSINIMDHYFKFPSKNYGPRHPYLQVSLMLYSDTFFPPLYYLLLLKFLIKDDREIEDIIVEREKFHA